VGALHLFVSPHYDDVALSCGGLVARLASFGERVRVVTVFGGAPPDELSPFAQFQHDRWGTGDAAVDRRRAEDARAMAILGAGYAWLDFPDAIYRGDLYLSDEQLFGSVNPTDLPLAAAVVAAIVAEADAAEQVYLPLAVGGHVDHRICRDAWHDLIGRGVGVRFYEDFPYAADAGAVDAALRGSSLLLAPELADVSDFLERRLAAVAAYASQLPTIFRHYGDPDDVTRRYSSALADRSGRYIERVWRVE
jgi:LmbE family N-acetylglucosaminyl deacetylase